MLAGKSEILNISASQLRGANVLITGATGFIGRHLSRALELLGARIFGLSRSASPDIVESNRFICDIADRACVHEIVTHVRPAYIFHLAANKARRVEIEDFRRCFDDNLIGTLNLLEACEALPNTVRFITLGTCEEYGGADAPYSEAMREVPVSAYSCSKVAVTQLLQTFHRIRGFPVVVLRPSLAYGPGQGDEMFLPALIKALLTGRRFPMSLGEQTRDYIYVDDVIEALLLAAVCPDATGQVINISSGEPTRIIEVAKLVAGLIGRGAEGLIDFGKLEYRRGEAMNYWAERTKARRLLGWQPRVDLPNGLARTVEYYRATLSGH